MRKAVFLDRDGTINYDYNYVYKYKYYRYILGGFPVVRAPYERP